MLNRRTILMASRVLILSAVLLGLFLFEFSPEKTSSSAQGQRTSTSVDLGITYLPITSGLSLHRDLGMNSGALVTEVAPGSFAARAGVEVGDVIVSFNGSRVEEETPLLVMMMAYTSDDNIFLEVQTGVNTRMVEIVHNRK